MTEEARSNPSSPSDTDSATRRLENDLNNEGPPSDEEGLSGEESAAAPPPVGGITFTPEQFQQLLAATSYKPKTSPTLVSPRVGGMSHQGVWTGFGRNQDQWVPVSHYCYRQFAYDDMKSMQALSTIEEHCKQGLSATHTVLFCRDTEPNAGKGALVLQELERFMINHGMEGVFRIVTATGDKIDMWKSPGLISKEMVATWMDDLTDDGVHDGYGKRLPVCPHDMTNLQLSAEAILNSCSESLRSDLYASIGPAEMFGPIVLYKVLQIVYRAELPKLKALEKELESLNITKVQAEDVSTYKVTASRLIREMQMNYPSPDPIHDLALKALSGLKYSTCDTFKNYIVQELIDLSSKPSDAKKASVALDRLDAAELQYLTLKQMDLYPPAKKPASEDPKYKAMMNKVSYLEKEMTKLNQDRSASSTRGNSNHGNGTNGRRKIACFICGGDHMARDHHKFANQSSTNGDNSSNNNNTSNSNRDATQQNGSGNGNRQGGGPKLSAEAKQKIKELIKEKKQSLPPNAQIPDDAEHPIKYEGKVVAKYCRHCKGFRAGRKMHSTKEHKGAKKVPYKPPNSDSQPAAGLHAAAQPESTEPTGPPPGLVQFGPRTQYDFSHMAPPGARPSGYLAGVRHSASPNAEAPADSDSDSSSHSVPAYMDVLNQRTVRPKGYGR